MKEKEKHYKNEKESCTILVICRKSCIDDFLEKPLDSS